jgi:hypothetical protein
MFFLSHLHMLVPLHPKVRAATLHGLRTSVAVYMYICSYYELNADTRLLEMRFVDRQTYERIGIS